MRSVFSFCAVCSADRRSICWARWWPSKTTSIEKTKLLLPSFWRKTNLRNKSCDVSENTQVLYKVVVDEETTRAFLKTEIKNCSKRPWICLIKWTLMLSKSMLHRIPRSLFNLSPVHHVNYFHAPEVTIGLHRELNMHVISSDCIVATVNFLVVVL